MRPYITEITPLAIAGWTVRVKLPNVSRCADIPAFFFSDLYQAEHEKQLGDKTYTLKAHFKKSNKIKHCEIILVYDSDPVNGEFNYFFGRAVVHPDDLNHILPDITVVELKGLYAIFTTPLVSDRNNDKYARTIRKMWNGIMNKWLPASEFEYDDTRKDFEYYDRKDHGQFFYGKKQMDIYIPIRQRKEAFEEAERKGLVFAEDYE